MHGGRECVTDTSIGTLKLLPSEIPSSVQKRQRKDEATQNFSVEETEQENNSKRQYNKAKTVNRVGSVKVAALFIL